MEETGIGLDTILFVVFLILKLTGYIDWSWWWVTAPLWIPVAIGLVAIVIFVIILGIKRCFNYGRKSKI